MASQVEPDDWSTFEDLLPDGGAPVFGIRMVVYVDDEGDISYSFGTDGSQPLAHTLGHLELLKTFLTHHRR